jgi:hypothetical protein
VCCLCCQANDLNFFTLAKDVFGMDSELLNTSQRKRMYSDDEFPVYLYRMTTTKGWSPLTEIT